MPPARGHPAREGPGREDPEPEDLVEQVEEAEQDGPEVREA